MFISHKGRFLPRVLSFGFIYLFVLFWSFGLKCLKEIIELRCGEIKKGIQLILEDLMMSENHPWIMIRWWLQCYELGTTRACEPVCACVHACVCAKEYI